MLLTLVCKFSDENFTIRAQFNFGVFFNLILNAILIAYNLKYFLYVYAYLNYL